jgi:peptide/nickel transport system permease protein
MAKSKEQAKAHPRLEPDKPAPPLSDPKPEICSFCGTPSGDDLFIGENRVAAEDRRGFELAKRSIEKFRHNKLAMLGLGIILIITLMCVLAPLLTSFDPSKISLAERRLAPGGRHPFGTDSLGRDVFARILYGGRMSILIGISGAAGGMIFGIILGSLCGYFGGIADAIIIKMAGLVAVIPQLLLNLVLVLIAGQSIRNLICVFTFTGWIATFRLVRGRFFSLREESFVEACRAFGIPSLSIAFRHILPNCLGPVVVQFTLNTAGFILTEAALSFIGLGAPSGTPTWGNVINAAREIVIIIENPWLWITPGFAIALFVLGINFFGDGLRDVLDPSQL